MSQSAAAPPAPSAPNPVSSRLVSLDALRGFDMFWIIGADSIARSLDKASGGKSGILSTLATQFGHASWEGFHFEDLIFPLFAFMVGMSLVFSLERIIATEGKKAAYGRLFRRFVLLYVVGIFYYGGLSHHINPADQSQGIRLVGVLPRLACCYFFAGLLYCNFRLRGLLIAFGVIMIGYWAMMSFIPVPKDFYNPGPGQPRISFDETNNLATYVDDKFLPGRRWSTSPDGKHYDPEGLLSTIPAIASSLLGVFAAFFIKNKSICDHRKVAYLAAAGVVFVVAGFAWGMMPWPFYFPVIKKIWTSSYVLVAGGYSCILLAIFYLLMDVLKYRIWALPFIWIGSNALTMYMIENLVDVEDKIAIRFVGGDIKDALGQYGDLGVTITALLLFVLLARFMYNRKLFIRL